MRNRFNAGALLQALTPYVTRTTRESKTLIPMAAALVLMMPAFAVWAGDHEPPGAQSHPAKLLAPGRMGTIGSTIGPDGALYVAEGALGRITRIDRASGKATTFATGLPASVPGVGIGGPMDVAFV